MPADIVFPQHNEKEFIQVAERLGYTDIVFVYAKKKDVPELKAFKTKVVLHAATLFPQRSLLTLAAAKDNLRHLLEHKKPDVIFGQEMMFSRDYMHQRGSGLDKVVCHIMHQQGNMLALSLHQLRGGKRAMIMGRIMQNIKLARKYKVQTVVASFAKTPQEMRSPHDIKALFTVLGMHSAEAKASLENIITKIKQNKRKMKGEVPGVRILE